MEMCYNVLLEMLLNERLGTGRREVRYRGILDQTPVTERWMLVLPHSRNLAERVHFIYRSPESLFRVLWKLVIADCLAFA